MNNDNKKYSLLFAIDNDLSIQIIESELKENNYLIKVVHSFEEALEEYKNRKSDIVILTSLGLDASQIIKYVVKLKIFDPRIKLLVISNYENENFINALYSAGVDIVHKIPIEFELLHSGIQSLL